MPSQESLDVAAALASAATKPLKIAGDAGSVEQHSLDELIAADKYLAAKDASSRGRRGLRFTTLVPGGAVQ